MAVLRVRDAGWSGDGELCAIEADHVHNLPALLLNFSPDLLSFYWNVERESFLRAANAHVARNGASAEFGAFEPAWRVLESRINRKASSSDNGPAATTVETTGSTRLISNSR